MLNFNTNLSYVRELCMDETLVLMTSNIVQIGVVT